MAQNSLAGIGMVLEKVKGKDVESMPVGKELARSLAWTSILERIADYCKEPRSLVKIAKHLGLSDRNKMKKKYIDPLLGRWERRQVWYRLWILF